VPPDKVALLGLSYKADTHIIEESHSIMLAKRLVESGYQVALHDPKALDSARDQFGNIVTCTDDPYECLTGATAVVLLTDWPQFRNLDWKRIATLTAANSLVLDSWRVVKNTDMSAFIYIPVGIGSLAKDTTI
jgi:UDPglucose 6-dehydrogenase